jgi:hypothetical protein
VGRVEHCTAAIAEDLTDSTAEPDRSAGARVLKAQSAQRSAVNRSGGPQVYAKKAAAHESVGEVAHAVEALRFRLRSARNAMPFDPTKEPFAHDCRTRLSSANRRSESGQRWAALVGLSRFVCARSAACWRSSPRMVAHTSGVQ